jgi:CHAT domain-containing protein
VLLVIFCSSCAHTQKGTIDHDEFFYREKVEFLRKMAATENDAYAAALHNLASYYYRTGDYANAEKNYLEAKDTWERIHGSKDHNYAVTVNDLGMMWRVRGDYEKAEQFYLEAKAIWEGIPEREDRVYAAVLNNLGAMYLGIGDYEKAEVYLFEAKNLWEKTNNIKHADYANALNNLGIVFADKGSYAEAEKYYLAARDVRSRTVGKKHPDYAQSLNNLGVLYESIDGPNNYTRAEKYYLDAQSIWEKTVGKEHPEYANTLDHLGTLYAAIGEYTKSEAGLLESKNIRERVLGVTHPDYAVSLNHLSFLYQDMMDYEKAKLYKQMTVEHGMNLINRNFSFLPEQQRSLYWDTIARDFEGSYSLSWLHSDALINGLNYDNTLFVRGLLLRTTTAVRDVIYSSKDAELINQYEQLSILRQQISLEQKKNDTNKEYIQRLETQANDLDKALTQASGALRDIKADMVLKWQDVRDHLKEDEAAVEFVSFQLYDKTWTGKIFYAALVLYPGIEFPEWIPLCEEPDLQRMLETRGSNTISKVNNIYNGNGYELYRMIWQPMDAKLKNIKTVYYSPAGLLNKISHTALPIDEWKNVLLTDKYNLYMVSSTREIVRRNTGKASASMPASAVVYGGLQYNLDKTAAAEKTSDSSARGTRGTAWDELPFTREEALRIHGYLEDKMITNTLFVDSLGNEESFKNLNSGETDLIHLATHGFFLADIDRQSEDRKLVQRLGGGAKALENPLLYSGLILAGGNHAWTTETPEGIEDGILTADEISRLNLTNARLVVLSACQTGLGEVKNSEGVFGLQRAFKLAGVETLIMSLWEVDDSATKNLMDAFYQQWLSGKSKQEAFKEAQQQIRGENPQPYYWAAFVMMD